ncbi:hypothetical protein WA158_005995 [Blastocystis sp. Blastoise]
MIRLTVSFYSISSIYTTLSPSLSFSSPVDIDMDFLVILAELINIIGYELAQFHVFIKNDADNRLASLLSIYFSISLDFLGKVTFYPSPCVYPVLEILIDYCSHIEQPYFLSLFPSLSLLPSVMDSIIQQMMFPENFDLSEDLSLNIDIYDYQTKVYKLAQTILKNNPTKVGSYVTLLLEQLQQNLADPRGDHSKYTWRYIEALYHLISVFGDSTLKDSMGPFVVNMLMCFSNNRDYAAHKHVFVISILEETIYRYTNLLSSMENTYDVCFSIYILGLQCQEKGLMKRSGYLLNKYIHKIFITDEQLEELYTLLKPSLLLSPYPSVPSSLPLEYLYILFEICSFTRLLRQDFDFHKSSIRFCISNISACIHNQNPSNNNISNEQIIHDYMTYIINCLTSILDGLQTFSSRQIENSSVPLPRQPDLNPFYLHVNEELIEIMNMITSLSSIYINTLDVYVLIVNLLKSYINIMKKEILPLLPSLISYLFSLPTNPDSSLYITTTSPTPIQTPPTTVSTHCLPTTVTLPPLLGLQLLSQIVVFQNSFETKDEVALDVFVKGCQNWYRIRRDDCF